VAYWDGIITQDQSGRTPVEILDSTELLQQEDHRIVFESLKRCHKAYTDFEKVAQGEQSAIKNKHKVTLSVVEGRHGEELRKEREKQDDMRRQMQDLEAKIEEQNKEIKVRDSKIDSFHAKEQTREKRAESLENTVANLQRKLQQEQQYTHLLVITLKEKEKDVIHRDKTIQSLSDDLRSIVVMQDQDIRTSLMETEISMRSMVSCQIALQKQLVGQTKNFKALLKKRGIAMPMSSISKISSQEEKEEQRPHEEIDPNEVANAVGVNAFAALRQPAEAV
jgi:hypothetical protein